MRRSFHFWRSKNAWTDPGGVHQVFRQPPLLNTNYSDCYSELHLLLSGLQTSVRDNGLKLQPTVKVIICEQQSIALRSYSHDATHLKYHTDVVQETHLATQNKNDL